MLSTLKRLLPTTLILFVFLINLCEAAGPSFLQNGRSNDDLRRLSEAFRDAVNLARVAIIAFNGENCNIATDAVFDRYFRPQDATFVEQILRTIANIDLNLQILPDTVLGVLRSTPLNPAFDRLSISIGDHPRGHHAECRTGVPGMRLFAYTEEQRDGSAYISVCDVCLKYPTIGDITHGTWPNGTPKGPGYGCNGLLNRETEFMLSCGATLLHEIVHWSALFHGIPTYNQLIPFDHASGFRTIDDFEGPDPVNGAGFYNAKRLKDLGHNPLNNADNYLMFVVSSYWRWQCRMEFGPALSIRDDSVRWDQIHGIGSTSSSGIPRRVMHKKWIPTNNQSSTEPSKRDDEA